MFPGSGRSHGVRKATHSSILAWKIPRAEKPGGLVCGYTKSWTQLSDRAHPARTMAVRGATTGEREKPKTKCPARWPLMLRLIGSIWGTLDSPTSHGKTGFNSIVARSNIRCLVKFKFQINDTFIFLV